MRTAIVWFRNDLRLADNPALTAALAAAEHVVTAYIHAPDEDAPWPAGAASRWWLHHSLTALDDSLRQRGARLLIARGPTDPALKTLIAATGATAVYWNRSYEPARMARDRSVQERLRAAGIAAESFPGNLLLEPWTVKNQAGAPFRVFTPFWRACGARLDTLVPPLAAPVRIPGDPHAPPGLAPGDLDLRSRTRWDGGLTERFHPGEAAAHDRLAAFLADTVAGYAESRDRPDQPGTSRLSPHLHFGEISPRQVYAATQATLHGPGPAERVRGIESFVREVGWREFAGHVLFHFPQTSNAPMDGRFAALGWRDDPMALSAWQQGQTGIPLVDAGMRELWRTGWMHNRVRMLAASMLTKNLGIHWLEGASWFHDTLVDADLASNSLGWQWTAGCGVDAAPYFRIFSPILQAERFDPSRAYLRTWLPELAGLPDEWIHRPWEAPARVLAAAGVALGKVYPTPIVDLGRSRASALERFAAIRGSG